MNFQDQERSNRARKFWKQKDQVATQIQEREILNEDKIIMRGSDTSWTSWRQKETELKVEESHTKSLSQEWKDKDEYPYNQRSRLSNAPNKNLTKQFIFSQHKNIEETNTAKQTEDVSTNTIVTGIFTEGRINYDRNDVFYSSLFYTDYRLFNHRMTSFKSSLPRNEERVEQFVNYLQT